METNLYAPWIPSSSQCHGHCHSQFQSQCCAQNSGTEIMNDICFVNNTDLVTTYKQHVMHV